MNRQSFLLACLIALVLLFIANNNAGVTAQITELSTTLTSSGLTGTQKTTYFTSNFRCGSTCSTYTGVKYTFSTVARPTAVNLRFVFIPATDLGATIIKTATLASTDDYNTGDVVPLVNTGTDILTPVAYDIFVYGEIVFASEQNPLTYTAPTSITNIFDMQYTVGNPPVEATGYSFIVNTIWGSNLGIDSNDVEMTEPDPLEFSTHFDQINDNQLPPGVYKGSIGYKTTLSFTNYHPDRIESIDLVLNGPQYWYVNVTKAEDRDEQWDYCLLNGVVVRPTLPYKNNQTVTLSVPEYLRINQGQLLTIACGSELAGVELIQDPRLKNLASGSEDFSGSQTLTLIPKYVTAGGATGGAIYPQSLYTYTINQSYLEAELEAYDHVNITPLFSFIDRKGKDFTPKSVSTMFSVDFESIDDFKKAFEITVEVKGLQKATDVKSAEITPRAIIIIEPDYSREGDIETKKQRARVKSPEDLYSPSFIVPLLEDVTTTPKLTIDEGFAVTYANNAMPQLSSSALPKRFVSVIIPTDGLATIDPQVPVEFIIRLRYLSKDETISNPPALIAMTALGNPGGTTKTKQFGWRTTGITNKNLEFKVKAGKKDLALDYPNRVAASFPTYKYRYAFSSALRSTRCTVSILRCRVVSTYSSGRRSPTTKCTWVTDSAARYSTTFASQHRVELGVTYYHNSDDLFSKERKIYCPTVAIVEQRPLVKDFVPTYDVNQLSLSTKQSPVVGVKNWSPISKSGVEPVITHSLRIDNEVVGYNEVYKFSGLSTVAIVMLALIPLWIAIVVVIIVVIIKVSK